jgi:dTDP-4-amino-4,6-dideoxygalactose transaminase
MYGIPVIEDCSHAHGAVYKGKSVGTWGAIGCFSLNSGKAVDAGEAGVAVTDDPRLFDHMLLLGHYRRMRHGQAANTFDVGDMNLGVKYRPHTSAIFLARASLKRLAKQNDDRAQAWRWLVEGLDGVPGLRPISETAGAVRGGYFSFVLAYEAAQQGGLSRDTFVEAAQAEGVPITAITPDQYGMLHKAPLFTTFNRPSLGGVVYDPTRSWEETLQPVTLPVTELMDQQLVRLPPLDTSSEAFIRRCGYALKKVMLGLVAQSKERHLEDAVERGSVAART